jgi:hypothetical protein
MQLLVIQCRHHQKKIRRACRTIYTRLSQYRLFSSIPTANFSSKYVAKPIIRYIPRKMVWPPKYFQRRREIIHPRSLVTQFGIAAGMFLRHHARFLGFRILPDGYVRASEMVISSFFLFLTIFEPVVLTGRCS